MVGSSILSLDSHITLYTRHPERLNTFAEENAAVFSVKDIITIFRL